MNRVIISGRFTKEHELRYNQTGTAILSNTIASNRKFKNAEGNYEADFINVVLFNQQAKFTTDYTKKGDMVLIEGRLQTRTYDDKDGKKVYVTEVIADSIEPLMTKKETKEQPKEEEIDVYSTFGATINADDPNLDLSLPF